MVSPASTRRLVAAQRALTVGRHRGFLRQEAHMRTPGMLADRVLQHIAAGGIAHPEIEWQALDHGGQPLALRRRGGFRQRPCPGLAMQLELVDDQLGNALQFRQLVRLGSMRLHGHDAERAEPCLIRRQQWHASAEANAGSAGDQRARPPVADRNAHR